MCRLYGNFASYLRRILCKTRPIFRRMNGPILPENLGYKPVPKSAKYPLLVNVRRSTAAPY